MPGAPQAPTAPGAHGAGPVSGAGAPGAPGGAEASGAQPALLWPSSPTIDNPLVPPPSAPYAPGAPGMPGVPGAPVTGAPLFGGAGAPVPGAETTGPHAPGFGAPGTPFGAEPTGMPFAGVPPQAPRRRGKWIALATVAVLLLLAGTVGGVLWLSRGGAGADEPSAENSATPMKPKKYKEWLAAVDSTLAPLYKQVVEATAVADIKRTATAAGDATRAAREKFSAQVPPTKADSGHTQVRGALTLLADELYMLAAGPLCTVNAARATLGTGRGAEALRTGAGALSGSDPGAGWTVGTFLPPATEVKTARPADGTMLKATPKVRNGGDFTFENNTSTDYVVVIVEAGTRNAVGAVYLHSNAGRVTVADVGSRNFGLYLQSGSDWDEAGGGFLKNCRVTKWKKDFDLNEFDWTIRPPGPSGGSENIEVIPIEDFPTFR